MKEYGLYTHINIGLISSLSTVCITFENKTHTGILRPVSNAHNPRWVNSKTVGDFNRNTD